MATDAEMRVIRGAIAWQRLYDKDGAHEEFWRACGELRESVKALFVNDPAWIYDERKDET